MNPNEPNNETATIPNGDSTITIHRSQVVTGMFFLTNEEANAQDDPYVDNKLPHFLMSDGTVRFGKSAAYGESVNSWWEEARTAEDYKENGYGPKTL